MDAEPKAPGTRCAHCDRAIFPSSYRRHAVTARHALQFLRRRADESIAVSPTRERRTVGDIRECQRTLCGPPTTFLSSALSERHSRPTFAQRYSTQSIATSLAACHPSPRNPGSRSRFFANVRTSLSARERPVLRRTNRSGNGRVAFRARRTPRTTRVRCTQHEKAGGA
jgi:hypothetical protein